MDPLSSILGNLGLCQLTSAHVMSHNSQGKKNTNKNIRKARDGVPVKIYLKLNNGKCFYNKNYYYLNQFEIIVLKFTILTKSRTIQVYILNDCQDSLKKKLLHFFLGSFVLFSRREEKSRVNLTIIRQEIRIIFTVYLLHFLLRAL